MGTEREGSGRCAGGLGVWLVGFCGLTIGCAQAHLRDEEPDVGFGADIRVVDGPDRGSPDVRRLPDGAIDPSLVPFASGAGRLLFFWLLPDASGVIAVSTREIVRVALDGTVRHPIVGPEGSDRELYAAALVEGGIVVAEGGSDARREAPALHRYSLDLAHEWSQPDALRCGTLFAYDAGLLCVRGERYRLHDPVSGRVLSEGGIVGGGDPYVLPGRDMVSFWQWLEVRGVGFHFESARFVPLNDLSAGSEVQWLDAREPTPDYGFVGLHGLPTRELISSDGIRYSFEDCLTTRSPTPSCYREIGRIPLREMEPPVFRAQRRFLASDPTITDSLFVVQGHRNGPCGNGTWTGPCLLLEVEVETGTVLREVGPFGLRGPIYNRLAVLPDRTAVLVASFARLDLGVFGDGWDLYVLPL